MAPAHRQAPKLAVQASGPTGAGWDAGPQAYGSRTRYPAKRLTGRNGRHAGFQLARLGRDGWSL